MDRCEHSRGTRFVNRSVRENRILHSCSKHARTITFPSLPSTAADQEPRVIKFILLKVKINFASCRNLLHGVGILIHCFQRLRGGARTFFVFFAVSLALRGASITHFVARVQFCSAAPRSLLASSIGTILTELSFTHKRTNVDTLHELER